MTSMSDANDTVAVGCGGCYNGAGVTGALSKRSGVAVVPDDGIGKCKLVNRATAITWLTNAESFLMTIPRRDT